jgi:hypothetical protein
MNEPGFPDSRHWLGQEWFPERICNACSGQGLAAYYVTITGKYRLPSLKKV